MVQKGLLKHYPLFSRNENFKSSHFNQSFKSEFEIMTERKPLKETI